MFNSSQGTDRTNVANSLCVAARGGFTAADLVALGELHAASGHLWGRGQLVSNEFAHFLAVWRPEAGLGDPPRLALARFKKTGTYSLIIGTTVVASGKRLSDVLPALLSGAQRRDDRSTP
jgi:hypothetical protein